MGEYRGAQFTRSIYLTASTGFLQVSRLSAGSTSELLVDATTRVQRCMGFKQNGAPTHYGRCVPQIACMFAASLIFSGYYLVMTSLSCQICGKTPAKLTEHK